METKQVKEIIEIFEASNLSHMELEEGNLKIRLEKPTGPAQNIPVSQIVHTQVEPKPIEDENKIEITSPLVGTFYRAKSPKDKPYVSVGDIVHKGDVVCMVEAMKTMNEIQSDQEGIVKEICVEDSSMVEYGQVLVVLGELE